MLRRQLQQRPELASYPMYDPETGEVDRSTVLTVLPHYKVEVSQDPGTPDCFLLIKGELVASYSLPAMVGRRLLQYFKRTFDIPIHHFYHPEMLDDGHGPIN
jgi:hypothetical protein